MGDPPLGHKPLTSAWLESQSASQQLKDWLNRSN
jgi:hypothetical protein